MKPQNNWKNVLIHPWIAKRPKTKEGFPVPFVNYVGPDGPDLKVLDQKKVRQAVQKRLCAICGMMLGETLVFIGGPKCYENHMFLDPAMHEVCARYAAQVCPFLALQNTYHSAQVDEGRDAHGTLIAHNPLAAPEGSRRPEKMMLYFTKGYKWINNLRVIEAMPPEKVEWF